MRDSDITEGLRVVTNDLAWGTVERREADGWHRIRLDSGALDIMNAERLSTTHPFGDADPHADERYRYGQKVWIDTRHGERAANVSHVDDGGPTITARFAGASHDVVYPRAAVRAARS